ncbi:f-box domain-containing protein [Caerostris extrusa]|uniref:F-box domain-containing protein n=1 Tax=Caerostris extrusa TaxID=172846 RepID=A0AAV4NUZ7_CAEEX|nr:f-box domain-containing protein [Caerostris extrusa]
MWFVQLVNSTGKWIYLFFAWLKMAHRLPAMIYSAPVEDEIFELDFGDNELSSVRRKTKSRDYLPSDHCYSNWNILPDILLEDIFSRLTIRERYYASQVCRNWNRLFYSKRIWETFILGDKTLTRRKFNYYMGDQYVLDHHRTQLCLHRIARGIRKLIITPMENFYNLYEFMTILSYFCENFESLHMIRTFDFTFGCELSPEVAQDRNKVFGTGGKLLEALKRLMDDLKGLRRLSLQDLLLEKIEARCLLDDVAYNCCESLRTLRLVNCSKEPVHHVLEGQVDKEVVWQEGAPVRSVVYDTPENKVSISCIFNATNLYCNTLEVFAYLGLPQYQLQDNFEDRVDISLILLSRCCLFLIPLSLRQNFYSFSPIAVFPI